MQDRAKESFSPGHRTLSRRDLWPGPTSEGGRSSHPAGNGLVTATGVVLVLVTLYFGKDFFIPFSLAVLLAFALFPIVKRLQQLRLPRVAAVFIAASLACVVICGVSYVVATQLIKLAEDLPSYRQTILEKVRSIRTSTTGGGGVVERVTTTMEGISQELSDSESNTSPGQPGPGDNGPPRPIPVKIVQGDRSAIAVVQAIVGPLLAPITTAGIVFVFVIFILLEREALRDRFIKLVGSGDLKTSTEALNDAATRVSRYLIMQLVVNVTYGVPIGIGLYFLGVPNAVLWGLLAAILRFIPFLGPFLAASFPLALAFAVDHGWSMSLSVLGLFIVIELISNNVVEPWLYGASTGLSSLAIIVAALVWTSLWGPIGLILSTPLTVCLVVIGRYVPQFEFFGVLLGSEPVLAPEEQLYQRLLADNTQEAAEVAEAYSDEHSLEEFYDQVAIPALRLAENDRRRNVGDGTFRRTVAEGMAVVVREVAEYVRSERAAEIEKSPIRESKPVRALGTPYLCIAGKTDLDRAVADMVAEVVADRGIGTRVLPPIAISQHGINQLDLAGVEVVVLSYLASHPQPFAKFVCRRLRRRAPSLKIIVGLWAGSPKHDAAPDPKEQMEADAVVFSVAGAAAQVDHWVARQLSDPMQAAPIPEDEALRMAVLRSLGMMTRQGPRFDELARKVAAAFGAPIALVTVVDSDHQLWPGAVGLPPKLDACRMGARETSICGHVVAGKEVLIVEDTVKDPRFANNAFLIENGIRFYAGAPLRTRAGQAMGSLCVIDIKPRTFSTQDRSVLQKIADDLMARVEAESERGRVESLLSRALDAATPESVDDLKRLMEAQAKSI